jgi:hypothetical protein
VAVLRKESHLDGFVPDMGEECKSSKKDEGKRMALEVLKLYFLPDSAPA